MRPARAGVMIAATCLLVAACTPSETDQTVPSTTMPTPTSVSATAGGPIPVVVDYSPTVSDVGGLLYLLSHPGVEVIAISLPVTGEAGCELGMEVTLGILAMMGRQEIPVACGSDAPAGANQWPEEFLAGHENLSFGLATGLASSFPGTASQLIAETVAGSDRPVTVWAVAPLTNLAQALSDNPEIVSGIEEVVIMGGAVDVPGNTFDGAAEWNLFIDPMSAAAVVASGVPITLVPLDATNQVPVPIWYQAGLAGASQSDQIIYLGQMVRIFPSVTSGFYYFWDELAAAVVAGEVEITSEAATISVVSGGGEQGRTVRDSDGSAVAVATGVVDPEAFYLEFISRLAGSPYQRPVANAAEVAYFDSLRDSVAYLQSVVSEVLSDPDFDSDKAYNPPLVAAGFDRIFGAFQASLVEAEAVEPPDDLAQEHAAYLAELQGVVAARSSIVEGLGNATTWEEAFSVFDQLPGNGACLALVEKAGIVGVDLELVCRE